MMADRPLRFGLCLVAAGALFAGALPALANDPFASSRPPSIPPEMRDDPLPAELRQGSFLAVPIPTSNPTIGTGLIGVGAYFWGQTEVQAAVQPPSVTGLAVMYTDTDSWMVRVGQTLYWDEDRWRLSAGAGTVELNLPLLGGDLAGSPLSIDWELDGELVFAELSRALAETWYAGLAARYIDLGQAFSLGVTSDDFELTAAVEAASLGPVVVRDSRDSTSYPRRGSYFKVSAMYTRNSRSAEDDYQSLDLSFQSYHAVLNRLVLAWRVKTCDRERGAPLWDACRVELRGFPATNYMGRAAQLAEIEARWQLSERWGAVAFAGAGEVRDPFSGLEDSDAIPSVGVGLRFLVQQAQHVNVRLDYARSEDNDAVYFFVGEAF